MSFADELQRYLALVLERTIAGGGDLEMEHR
jgi:hypothetical protein